MRSLSFIVVIVFTGLLYGQSPHGNQLNIDCSYCHQPESWQVNPDDIRFDHSDTEFELTGQHISADCRSCHSSLIFSRADDNCVSCHKDIHQATVGFDCSSCHTPDSWLVKDINEIHKVSRFPLLGAHLTADCSQCHAQFSTLNFTPLGVRCYDCHAADFQQTSAPNHIKAGFSTECEDCHSLTSMSWGAENFMHDFFPLTGGHDIADCFQCHRQGSSFTDASPDCFSCHNNDYLSVTDPNHAEGNFSKECLSCHNINAWSPADFDHNLTQFPLSGAHINTSCQSCHSSGFNIPFDCYSCHQTDYNNTQDPNHQANNYSLTCTECHSTNNWEEVNFDHNLTAFQLTGAHVSVNCADCHSSGFNNTPADCYSCHQSDYDNSTNPNHASAGFPVTCADCHNTSGFVPAQFNHDAEYFPIYSGRHAGTWNNCSDCHTSASNFAQFSCVTCHEHNQTDMDNEHAGISGYVYLSSECFACHPTGDDEGAFNHALSGFPLTGAHVNIDCALCHSQGYANTASECSACHNSDYNQTLNPNHAALQLSADCSSCHTTNEGWQPALFPQHNQYFPLTGKHSLIASDCIQCHNGNYSNTPAECSGCHITDYNNSTSPDHQAAGISTDCGSCHESSGWVPSSFNHAATGFALIGQHAVIQCSSCHQASTSGAQSECITCHQEDYNSALNPDHASAGISTECGSCHTPVSWIPSGFSHTAVGFELTGSHAGIQCSSCHQGSTTGLNQQCASCHQTDYAAAPGHQSQGYPLNCEMCHGTTGWLPASFDHSTTNFPLTGAHINTNCGSCHSGGFTGTPSACVSCHETDYNQSTNPGHLNLGLSLTCESCHTTNTGWQPALFPEHNNYYQLIGAHLSISNDCISCHNGNYNNTPETCIGCHQQDYNLTVDPPHVSQNFSEQCLDCHNMNGWTPANFNHSFYPISSDHNNVSCAQCHSQPNYQPQCLSCHQDDFFDEHEPGDPTNCWDCHTTNDWDDDRFLRRGIEIK